MIFEKVKYLREAVSFYAVKMKLEAVPLSAFTLILQMCHLNYYLN